jgi:hypothetical protein
MHQRELKEAAAQHNARENTGDFPRDGVDGAKRKSA